MKAQPFKIYDVDTSFESRLAMTQNSKKEIIANRMNRKMSHSHVHV